MPSFRILQQETEYALVNCSKCSQYVEAIGLNIDHYTVTTLLAIDNTTSSSVPGFSDKHVIHLRYWLLLTNNVNKFPDQMAVFLTGNNFSMLQGI